MLYYTWDFGDGTGTQGYNKTMVSHIYYDNSAYQAKVTVTYLNERAEDAVTITVNEPVEPPSVTLTANPTSGDAPLNVDFNANAENFSGNPLYIWDFGDGQTQKGYNSSVPHTYNNSGAYQAKVTVTYLNERAEDAVTITVNEPVEPPSVTLTANPTSGDAPLNVDFSAVARNFSGTMLYYTWDFGDGTGTQGYNRTMVSHTYIDEGAYLVKVTVTYLSERAEDTVTIIVKDDNPGDPRPAPPSLKIELANPKEGVILSWRDNSNNEDGFIIYRKGGYGRFIEIGRVGANETTYTDKNVSIGVNYDYRVSAYNSFGESASNTVRIKLKELEKPKNLEFYRILPRHVIMTWEYDLIALRDIGGFRIYRSEYREGDGWSEYTRIGAKSPSGTKYYFSDNNPFGAERFRYYVRAYERYDSRVVSDKSSIIVTNIKPPQNLKVDRMHNYYISLTWDYEPEEKIEIEGFYLYRSFYREGEGWSEYTKIKSIGASKDITHYRYSDNKIYMIGAEKYRYYLIAYVNDILSNKSNVAEGVPPPPKNLKVIQAYPSHIVLSWDYDEEKVGGLAGFYLYRSYYRKRDGWSEYTKRFIGGNDDITHYRYSDSRLVGAEKYRYYVRARVGTMLSGKSNTVEATPE